MTSVLIPLGTLIDCSPSGKLYIQTLVSRLRSTQLAHSPITLGQLKTSILVSPLSWWFTEVYSFFDTRSLDTFPFRRLGPTVDFSYSLVDANFWIYVPRDRRLGGQWEPADFERQVPSQRIVQSDGQRLSAVGVQRHIQRTTIITECYGRSMVR